MDNTELTLRKICLFQEEIHRDGEAIIEEPIKKSAAAAVLKNPFAGMFQEDLTLLYEWSEKLGAELTQKAVHVLGVSPDAVESYGKAAIVGERGELEHCAALMHPALGKPMWDNVGGGKALIPSAKKRGGVGAGIDVPLGHKNAALVRSHFDAMEVRIPDAPAADELVLIISVTNAGRPAARVGGLSVDQIKGEDGLR